MGKGVDIKIKGAKQLAKDLGTFSKNVATKITRKALRAGAKIIQKAAKANAPKLTGLTKKSIKVRAAKKKRGRVAILVQIGAGDYQGQTFYASFLEYGVKRKTENPDSESEGGNYRIQPMGFIRRAYDEKADAAAQAIEQAFREEIKKARAK